MPVNILKSAMKGGLILGVLFSLNFLLSVANVTFLNVLTYLIIAFILVATYRLTTGFRDNDCKGYISYSWSLLFIMLLFFYASLISTLVKFVYFKFINPDYLVSLYNEMMILLENFKITGLDEAEQSMSELFRPASFSFQYMGVNMFMGVLVGLIMAAFTKKERSIFDRDENLPEQKMDQN